MNRSLPGILVACVVASTVAPMPALSQSVPSSVARGNDLPRFASTVPAAAGDVPGVSMAYEEPSPAPGAGSAEGFRAWGQYVYTSARLGADRNGAAIRSSGNGFALGIERAVDPSLVLGVTFGYAQGRASSTGVRSDSEAFSGAAYAWWNPVAALEVDALLGGTGLGAETSRLVTLGGTPAVLRGETGGLGFSGLAAAGYRFRSEVMATPTYVKPFVSLAYASQDRAAYVESAPGGGLAFPGRVFERAAVNVGVAAGVDLATPWGMTLRPEASLAWSRQLIDPSPAVAVFDVTSGQGYVLRDPRPGRDGLVAAAEIALWDTPGLQGFVGYTGEFRGNATLHQARIGLRSNW